MSPFTRRALSLSLLCLTACQVNPAAKRPVAAARASVVPASTPAATGTSSLLGARTITAPELTLTLTGKVKLLSDAGSDLVSDHGGGIISDNSAGLISNNGSGIIANNSGGIVANNGGGLTGKAKRQVLAAAAASPPKESLLSNARLEVLDGAGKQLVDAKGAPVGGVADVRGQFHFTAGLPKENLVLRVSLSTGGQLRALLVPGSADSLTLDLDTASSLGASYVLDKYVKGAPGVYGKLPAADATGLTSDIEAARGLLPQGTPAYKSAELTASLEALRAKDHAVDSRLQHIASLLLAGQANLGSGLGAGTVSLVLPQALAGDAQGNLYIGEYLSGRIRMVSPAGVASVLSDERFGKYKFNFYGLSGLAVDASGSCYVASDEGYKVSRITPAGVLELVVGTGARGQAPVGTPGASANIWPLDLGFGADHRLLITERNASTTAPGRLVGLDDAAKLTDLAIPASILPTGALVAVSVAANGVVYALNQPDGIEPDAVLLRRALDGSWSVVASDSKSSRGKLAASPDGGVYVAEDKGARILRFAPDGTRTVYAGTGVPGYDGDGGQATAATVNRPMGLYLAPDGTLYYADRDSSVVRAIDPKGVIRTVAGVAGFTQDGLGTTVTVAAPWGITLDPTGRLVFAESSGSTLKRIDQGAVTVVGRANPARDQAGVQTPRSPAYHDGKLYFLDDKRLCRLEADGTVTTVFNFTTPVSCLAFGPDGLPYVSCSDRSVVWRVSADGKREDAVGQTAKPGDFGDGGLASRALLQAPLGLAFDSHGDLYIADAFNSRIRKVTHPTLATATIDTYAGRGLGETLGKLADGTLVEGHRREDPLFVIPTALCFDAQDNLYVADVGSRPGTLSSFAASSGSSADTTLTDAVANVPHTPGRIRRVSVAGDVTTVLVESEDGREPGITLVLGLAIDHEGRLAYTDSGANQVRVVPLP